ncbi:MAG: MmcQ/YjbR family DNA-binding protein [Verrucomicrobiota bacterium]
MNEIETIHETLLAYPETEVSEPFGLGALVYKVSDKMFALMWVENVPVRLNLKCDPDRAIELRDEYDSIEPGYHMNKKHWNSVYLDGGVPDGIVLELIRHSFDCVLAKQSKAFRVRILHQLTD